MSSDAKTLRKTLTDSDIQTRYNAGRRGFLGLMAVSGAAALTSGRAHAEGNDTDSGILSDLGGCGRGSGGVYTGETDADDGNIFDAAGYGRGEPNC